MATSIKRGFFIGEGYPLGTLPALCRALEIADGREQKSLGSYAALCRREGLIAPSPVGKGALPVTSTDAVALLLASAIPVPLRLMQTLLQAFRAMPRTGKPPTTFRVARKRYLTMPESAGEFLELAIAHAPQLPDNLRIECRFSPVCMALIAGVDRAIAVEYRARVRIALEPPGGDRVIEHGMAFGIETLRLVHGAIARQSPLRSMRRAGRREEKSFSGSGGGAA